MALGEPCCDQTASRDCPAGQQCIGAACNYEFTGNVSRLVGPKGKCLSPVGGPCQSGTDCVGGAGNNKTAFCGQKTSDPSEGKICKGLDIAPAQTEGEQPRLAIPDPKLNIPFGNLDEALKSPTVETIDGTKYLVIPWLALYIGELYKYALGIVTLIAVLMIMVGGIVWLTAGGNQERVANAKKYISGSLIGLALALFSYTILRTINPALIKFESLKIQQVGLVETERETSDNTLCSNPNNPTKFNDKEKCENQTTCSSQNACVRDQNDWCCACLDCEVIPGNIPRKGGIKGNKLHPELIKKLQNLTSCSEKWVITEAYPPDVSHQSPNHYNGKAVDIALRPAITSPPDPVKRTDQEKERIINIEKCAENAGFKVTNEYYKRYKNTTGNHLHLE